jgi:hypothetical protein
MVELSDELKANYQARHDSGISWAAIASTVDDDSVVAWLRSQAEPDAPRGKSGGKQRTAEQG